LKTVLGVVAVEDLVDVKIGVVSAPAQDAVIVGEEVGILIN
jgi:hypothetical protein